MCDVDNYGNFPLFAFINEGNKSSHVFQKPLAEKYNYIIFVFFQNKSAILKGVSKKRDDLIVDIFRNPGARNFS